MTTKRPPHAAVAAAASAVVPGLGQLLAGRRRRGLAFLAPHLVLLPTVAWLAGRGELGIARLLVTPAFLRVAFVVVVALGLWRILAIVDAWRVAGGGRGVGVVVPVLLVVAVALPHGVVAAYELRAVRLLERVFVTEPAASAATTIPEAEIDDFALPEPTIVPRPARGGLIRRDGIGDPEAVELWHRRLQDRHAPPPFVPFHERVDADRITILLAGGDAGPGRSGLRTDTMIVATLDLETGRAAIFGIPRNYGHVPLPKRFEEAFVELERRLFPPPEPAPGEEPVEWEPCRCFPAQLNSLYPRTRTWRRTFQDAVDPGMEMLRRTLSYLLGLDIDYYALVDMKGFVDVVDAIGGVTVYVDKPLVTEVSPPAEGEPWIELEVDVGYHHLDGRQALAWVRARKGSSDYTRMRRQRCMLKAVAAELDVATVLRSFPAIADAIERSVTTDVPLTLLPDLVRELGRLDLDDVVTVGLVPPYYAPERDPAFNAIPDLDRIRSKVRRVLAGESGGSGSGGDECLPPAEE
ncbi:MAG TPA: LytR family transcriptional regulator [Actinobacteria bacterium]|nr:LytR family transcriptional regulator [Actinomycetota bacterium]